MPIYRLTPIDLADRDWLASTYSASVLVRAGSEDHARQLPLWAFGVAVDKRVGTGLAPPWRHSSKVLAEVVEDVPYPSDGPECVLEPAGHYPAR